MSSYKMTPKELILTSGSSRGSQIKFFKDGYWYKIDEHGPEGVAEETVSKMLQCSSLSENEFTKYETCEIEYDNGESIKRYNGCRSKDFLNPGEMFYSYEKVYQLMTGKELNEDIIRFNSPKERIDFVASVIKDFSGLDVKDCIAKNLTCDMFFLNTDRHFNNLGIISNLDQTQFRNVPIFDNGAAFLSNYTEYPPNFTVKDLQYGRQIVTGKPFAANLEYQAIEAGLAVQFDFDKMRTIINDIPNERIRDFANYQVSKYKSVLQIEQYQGVSFDYDAYPKQDETLDNIDDETIEEDGFDPADED